MEKWTGRDMHSDAGPVEQNSLSEEVAMKTVKTARALLVIGLLSGVTLGAHAAGSYMLTCDAAKGATLNMTLTGFSFKVTGAEEAATGMAAGKRSSSNFELMIRFTAGRDYETFLSVVEDNEILRSCKLVDGAGGGAAATDDWNQMSTEKGKRNRRYRAMSRKPVHPAHWSGS